MDLNAALLVEGVISSLCGVLIGVVSFAVGSGLTTIYATRRRRKLSKANSPTPSNTVSDQNNAHGSPLSTRSMSVSNVSMEALPATPLATSPESVPMSPELNPIEEEELEALNSARTRTWTTSHPSTPILNVPSEADGDAGSDADGDSGPSTPSTPTTPTAIGSIEARRNSYLTRYQSVMTRRSARVGSLYKASKDMDNKALTALAAAGTDAKSPSSSVAPSSLKENTSAADSSANAKPAGHKGDVAGKDSGTEVKGGASATGRLDTLFKQTVDSTMDKPLPDRVIQPPYFVRHQSPTSSKVSPPKNRYISSPVTPIKGQNGSSGSLPSTTGSGHKLGDASPERISVHTSPPSNGRPTWVRKYDYVVNGQSESPIIPGKGSSPVTHAEWERVQIQRGRLANRKSAELQRRLKEVGDEYIEPSVRVQKQHQHETMVIQARRGSHTLEHGYPGKIARSPSATEDISNVDDVAGATEHTPTRLTVEDLKRLRKAATEELLNTRREKAIQAVRSKSPNGKAVVLKRNNTPNNTPKVKSVVGRSPTGRKSPHKSPSRRRQQRQEETIQTPAALNVHSYHRSQLKLAEEVEQNGDEPKWAELGTFPQEAQS